MITNWNGWKAYIEGAKDRTIEKAAEIERKPPIWALVLFTVVLLVAMTAARMAVR